MIAAGGDGDGFAIGAGHFLHAVRRNPNVTYIVMDNQTYGLTKGQSSPTSAVGYVTGTSPSGNPDAPLDGIAVALAAGGTYLARGFSAQPKKLVALIKDAIQHPGFSVVQVMSPCVTFNKINTFQWFKENIYDIEEVADYDTSDRSRAFNTIMSDGKIAMGVLYREIRPTLEDMVLKDTPPLVGAPPWRPDSATRQSRTPTANPSNLGINKGRCDRPSFCPHAPGPSRPLALALAALSLLSILTGTIFVVAAVRRRILARGNR